MTTALRSVRLARGQSLRQLAADVGISYETLRRMEDGRTTQPYPSTRVALERALGVPVDVLLTPTNDNAPVREDEGAENGPTTAKQQEVRS